MSALFFAAAGLCAWAAYHAWDSYDTVGAALLSLLVVALVAAGTAS